MPVVVESTPNPNAVKFSVGVPVGGPATYAAGAATDNPLVDQLLAIDDVASVFMTADFVTLTKTSDGDWSAITPLASEILDSHFP